MSRPMVEDANHDSVLRVTVELASGRDATESRQKDIASAAEEHLIRLNSEFAHHVPKERQHVDIRLMRLGDPSHFPAGVKHRYTR